MTAVVAVLNKTGMALAADSAVTVSNSVSSQSKVFNTANKVFTLSKYHPIAIMIYSSASFLSTPWEVIIKLYRQELKKQCFDNVEDYYHDFMKFLLTNKMLNLSHKEKDYIERVSLNISENIINKFFESLNFENSAVRNILISYEKTKNLDKDKKDELIKCVSECFDKILQDNLDDIKTISNLDVYNEKTRKFDEKTRKFVADIFIENISKYLPLIDDITLFKSCTEQFINLVLNILTKNIFAFGSTGLIFAGYGKKQIYPALYSIELDGIFNSKIRHVKTYDIQISDKNDADLIPYAQADVMKTFLDGISPEMKSLVIDSVEQTFGKLLIDYSNTINIKLSDKLDDKLINDIQSSVLKNAVEAVKNQIQNIIVQSQSIPTLAALRSLSKEDLAELAENLIYLTFLKRRTSSSIESVGGAVDVAIISKGDGFIWKKRKHYFEKDLNQQFFQNYFNS